MKIALIIILGIFFLPFVQGNTGGKKNSRKTAVEVNFALIDKQGNSSKVFKEGEELSFSIILTNNSGDSLYLDDSFLAEGNGLCAVYSQDNKLVGQPFAFSGAQIVSSDSHPFYGDHREYTLIIPWTDSRPLWSTLHHNFKGLKQKNLPKGKYYTIFKNRFCFDRSSGKPSLCLQPTEIRIDFEVI